MLMNRDSEKWPSHLPIAEEVVGEGIVLNGWLVPSKPETLCIVTSELCLVFHQIDIIEIESVTSIEDPAELQPAIPVRIVIRREAPILDIRLAKLREGLSPQHRPFALAVRPLTITIGPANRFRDLERGFLEGEELVGS